jgi:hypothetical protein
MTVAELRELLECLPGRFDETEVMIYTTDGLVHVSTVELDRREVSAEGYSRIWSSLHHEPLSDRARQRKLRINGRPHRRIWHDPPPAWRLEGWWPKEAAEIGLEAREA